MNLPDQIKRQSIQKIAKLAKSILEEKVNLIEASREINRLKSYIKNPDDTIFDTFLLTVSDTDHIPIGEKVRKNYSVYYLRKIDKDLEEYLADMKSGIIKACKELIKKYS